jgi:hypothetical protein
LAAVQVGFQGGFVAVEVAGRWGGIVGPSRFSISRSIGWLNWVLSSRWGGIE